MDECGLTPEISGAAEFGGANLQHGGKDSQNIYQVLDGCEAFEVYQEHM
jgi:hypothetical protein